MADGFVDELVPDEIDWRRLVRSYPFVSLALVGVGGYLLGRSRGRLIVGALSAHAAAAVSRNINELLGEDVLQ